MSIVTPSFRSLPLLFISLKRERGGELKLKVRSKSIVVTLSTKAISLALVIVDNNSNTTSLLPGKKRENFRRYC